MEYALPSLIIIFFAILSIILTKKPRTHFVKTLSADDLNAYSLKKSKICNKNSKSNGKVYSIKKFLKTINRAKRKSVSYQNDKIIGEYVAEFQKTICSVENKLKILKKSDFSVLSTLIGDKCARIENVLRIILESDRFSFAEKRAEIVFENFNLNHTITYSEIKNANLMKDYILVEKLFFISDDILSLIKIKKYAEKASQKSNFFEKSSKFKWLKENSIFLKFAHFEKFGENSNFHLVEENSKNAFSDKIAILQNLKKSLTLDFDFSKYYLPLELLNHFEVFRESSALSKDNFLSALSKFSSNLNLDEYAYSYSLSKYAIQNHSEIQAKTLNLLSKRLIFYKSGSDMKMLKNALVSKELMAMTFGKYSKSILKNQSFENTFAYFTRSYPINLGILRHNDSDIEICPSLPDFVKNLNFSFENDGVIHNVFISKSIDGEKSLKVNGTILSGVSVVRLSDKPLNIEITTKE